jgi:hypothetical protein
MSYLAGGASISRVNDDGTTTILAWRPSLDELLALEIDLRHRYGKPESIMVPTGVAESIAHHPSVITTEDLGGGGGGEGGKGAIGGPGHPGREIRPGEWVGGGGSGSDHTIPPCPVCGAKGGGGHGGLCPNAGRPPSAWVIIDKQKDPE